MRRRRGDILVRTLSRRFHVSRGAGLDRGGIRRGAAQSRRRGTAVVLSGGERIGGATTAAVTVSGTVDARGSRSYRLGASSRTTENTCSVSCSKLSMRGGGGRSAIRRGALPPSNDWSWLCGLTRTRNEAAESLLLS